MVFRIFLFATFLFVAPIQTIFESGALGAQEVAEPEVAEPEVVDVAEVRVGEDIKYLASDELKGREPGTPEMKLAEDYIVQAFKEAGLEPGGANNSYLQPFDVVNRSVSQAINTDTTHLQFNAPHGESLPLNYQQQYVPMAYDETYSLDGLSVVFVGYGINATADHNYNDYRDIDVEGKIVILIRGEPQQNDAHSVFDGMGPSQYSYLQTKVDAAIAAKAAAILMVNDADRASENEDALVNPSQFGRVTKKIPFVHLKRSVFNQILEQAPVFTAAGEPLTTLAEVEAQIDATLEPLSQILPDWKIDMAAEFVETKTNTSNIIGVIPGQGPLAEETIVIGAHYDHLGMGNYGSRSRDAGKAIHNGADDNATGTAAVMELARRFSQQPAQPSRRIVFICFSAEELGLLGAKHYVENPVVPIEQTIAMINFDMIGYLREDALMMFGWETSSEFDALLADANQGIDLNLVKPPGGFAGSDHMPFNARKVPNVFFNTGLTGVYHTPDDDFEAIDVPGAVRVIDFSEAFIDRLRAVEKRPPYDFVRQTRQRVKLGINVSVDKESRRLVIDRVLADSIAEKSGVKAGDRIISFNGKTGVNNQRRLSREIRRATGKMVQVILDREGEAVILEMDLKNPE